MPSNQTDTGDVVFRSRCKNVLRKAPLVAASILFAPLISNAALIPDGATDASYVAYGQSQVGKLLWFQAELPNGGFEHVSATYLDPWDVLTAGHCVTGTTGTAVASEIEIGTGSNYLTDPGTVVGVSSFTIYPTYVAGSAPASTIDLAIIHLAQILPGTDMTISSSSAGEILTGAGFGSSGTPSTGLQVADGNSRAWNAAVDASGPVVGSSTDYLGTDFEDGSTVQLNGKAESGDSGGPLLDASGNLIGINIAQSGGTDPFGQTISLKLSEPDVEEWISENTTVPEPVSVMLMGMLGLTVSFGRGRNKKRRAF